MTDKPAMPANLREIAIVAKSMHRERFAVPCVVADPEGFGWRWGCPYRDEDWDDWQALLFEAFGTRSLSVVESFLSNLARFCGKAWDEAAQQWQPDMAEMNTAIAVMASCKPSDEAQACLAAQMVSLHFTAMKLGGLIGDMTYPDERTAATMARVSKTYANLARTLAQLQGKATRHEQHFHYHDERHVHLGEGHNSGGQPLAQKEIEVERQSAGGPCVPALPSPCPDQRETLLRPCGERQASVPDAWWSRLRRTFRRS